MLLSHRSTRNSFIKFPNHFILRSSPRPQISISGVPHSIEYGTINYLWIVLTFGLVSLFCCLPLARSYHKSLARKVEGDLNEMVEATKENLRIAEEMRQAEMEAEILRKNVSNKRAGSANTTGVYG